MMLFGVGTAFAQGETITEGDFWRQLAQTEARLDDALNRGGEARADVLSLVRAGWADVSAVALDNGAVLPVDVSWLQIPNDADNAAIQTVQTRIRGLQSYGGEPQNLSLDELRALLDEYGYAPADGPMRDTNPRLLSFGEGAYSILRGLLLIGGIALVVGVLVTVARGLRWDSRPQQRRGLALDDDPETVDDATARAQAAEQAGKLREAVRYRYLACLLRLDECGLLRYDPSLTNQEHMRQVADNEALHRALLPIVATFDRAWYGFRDLSPADYAAFQRRIAQLDALVEAENTNMSAV